jgi:hypothetical protein
MEVVIQLCLLTVSVCVGAVALVLRTTTRSSGMHARFDVDPVSSSWLAEHKTRSRPE